MSVRSIDQTSDKSTGYSLMAYQKHIHVINNMHLTHFPVKEITHNITVDEVDGKRAQKEVS